MGLSVEQHLGRFASFLAGLLMLGASARADEAHYRSELYVKLVSTKRVDFTVWGQVGFSDSTPNPNRYLAGPKLAFNVLENLAVGVNYSYFERQLFNPLTHDSQAVGDHRAEVEINPHWTFQDGVQLNLRNRWEHRWFVNSHLENDRSRHRIELVFPMKRTGALTDVFTQAEGFWDYDRGVTSEWRIVPLGLTFRLAPQLRFRTFYMWHQTQPPSGWQNAHVFYTQILFSL
jgi:hypothetical protein